MPISRTPRLASRSTVSLATAVKSGSQVASGALLIGTQQDALGQIGQTTLQLSQAAPARSLPQAMHHPARPDIHIEADTSPMAAPSLL